MVLKFKTKKVIAVSCFLLFYFSSSVTLGSANNWEENFAYNRNRAEMALRSPVRMALGRGNILYKKGEGIKNNSDNPN